jgi:hypothetical protein
VRNTDDSALTRYLCGTSTEEEKTSLEERFFREDDLFDQLLEAEDDLVDSFARGTLPSGLRDAFEKRVADSPALRERVAFARSLARVWTPARRRPVPLALAAAVILLVGSAWTFLQIRALRSETGQLTAENGRMRQEIAGLREASREESLRNEARVAAAGPARIAAFTLAEGLTRGGAGANRFALPAGVEALFLDVPVPSKEAGRYRVSVETPEGRKIAVLEDLPGPSAPSRTLRVALPASLLVDGDYVLSVHAASSGTATSLADYAFRIVRQ